MSGPSASKKRQKRTVPKKPHKLFRQNMPGNYMPANGEGWLVLLLFIGLALAVVALATFIGHLFESSIPPIIGWTLFIVILIQFVRFAKRHS